MIVMRSSASTPEQVAEKMKAYAAGKNRAFLAAKAMATPPLMEMLESTTR